MRSTLLQVDAVGRPTDSVNFMDGVGQSPSGGDGRCLVVKTSTLLLFHLHTPLIVWKNCASTSLRWSFDYFLLSNTWAQSSQGASLQ